MPNFTQFPSIVNRRLKIKPSLNQYSCDIKERISIVEQDIVFYPCIMAHIMSYKAGERSALLGKRIDVVLLPVICRNNFF